MSFMRINSKDISVVIQGTMFRNSNEPTKGIDIVLPKIRKFFPDAEIIVSTWQGEDVSGLDVDRVVLSEDPGGFPDIKRGSRNLNRQIVTTVAGVKASTRDYVLKTRCDIVFTSAEIAQIGLSSESSFLDNPITMTNIYVRSAIRSSLLFHPSDIVHFGLRKDVLSYWDIPLEIEYDIRKRRTLSALLSKVVSTYSIFPEQSLCLGWLKKNGINIVLNSPSFRSFRLIKQWEEILTKEFRVLDYQKAGIQFPPHFYRYGYDDSTIMTSVEIDQIRKSLKDGSYDKNIKTALIANEFKQIFRLKYWLVCFSNAAFVFSPALYHKLHERRRLNLKR